MLMLVDPQAVYITEFVLPDVISEYVPESYQDKGLKTGRALTISAVRHSRVLDVRPDNEDIALLATGVTLGDELVEKEREQLTDGLLDKQVEEEPRLELFLRLKEKAASPEFIDKLYEASQKQDLESTQAETENPKKLKKVTFDKGGYTIIAALHFFKEKPGGKEEKLSYDLGKLGQCMDDYGDIKEDRKSGKKTPFTEGYMSREDIVEMINRTEEEYMDYYRDTWLEVRRMFDLMRLYLFLADLIKSPIPVPKPLYDWII